MARNKGYGSVLGLSSLVGWGMGSCPPEEMFDTGRPGIGGPLEASAIGLGKWVSPGLEARELWV